MLKCGTAHKPRQPHAAAQVNASEAGTRMVMRQVRACLARAYVRMPTYDVSPMSLQFYKSLLVYGAPLISLCHADLHV